MVKVIKPNLRKVLLVNVLKTFFILLLLMVLAVILDFTGGLDSINDSFEGIGVSLTFASPLTFILIAVATIFLLVLLISYFSVLNVRYEFSDSYLMAYKTVFIIVNSKKIPYKNIMKVNFEKNGFFNEMLNTGTIILDISSMGYNDSKMKYVDKPASVASYINDVLSSYQRKVQTEYTAKYRMSDILDKGKM